MKFLADCKTNPVAIMANPSTPIHIAVKPGPMRASTELDIPSTAFSAMAAPVANNPNPGSPKTSRGFFCERIS